MVKRYTLGRSPVYGLENNVREFDMVESAHGEYVGLHDYRALAERCERLEAALRALVDYDSEAYSDMSLLDNGPLWDQAEAALSETAK